MSLHLDTENISGDLLSNFNCSRQMLIVKSLKFSPRFKWNLSRFSVTSDLREGGNSAVNIHEGDLRFFYFWMQKLLLSQRRRFKFPCRYVWSFFSSLFNFLVSSRFGLMVGWEITNLIQNLRRPKIVIDMLIQELRVLSFKWGLQWCFLFP